MKEKCTKIFHPDPLLYVIFAFNGRRGRQQGSRASTLIETITSLLASNLYTAPYPLEL